MPELSPVRPVPIESIDIERSPTSAELALWNRLLHAHSQASDALDIAGLLLENLYTVYTFADKHNIRLESPSPELEEKYYELRDSFKALTSAIRAVQDHSAGIRIASGNDIDIIEPSNERMDGLIIPVIIGAVIVAGAIAVATYQTKQSVEIAMEYRRILATADKHLCNNKNSDVCKKWETEKKQSGYVKNKTLSEQLTRGVSNVSSGLKWGLLIGIPVGIYLLATKRGI
jgi:hypothetical protein